MAAWLVLIAGAFHLLTAAPTWRPVIDGVEHLHIDEGQGEALRFDLTRFGVEISVPGAARPVPAAAARAQRRALLAVNGGFFDTNGRPLGLRIDGAKVVQGLRPRVDWGVLLVRPGHARIVHSRQYRPDPQVTAAIQVGPRILIEGQVPGLKPQSSRRTAVAVDRTGRFLTVLVTRSRVTATALGETLARLGFDSALLLDGGPSAQLSAAIGPLVMDIPGGYPVPDLLLIVPRAP